MITRLWNRRHESCCVSPFGVGQASNPPLVVGRRSLSTIALKNDEDSSSSPLVQQYNLLVQQGTKQGAVVQSDPHQLQALQELERLRSELTTYEPPSLAAEAEPTTAAEAASTFGSWFGGGSTAAASMVESVATTVSSALDGGNNAPRGVYLHGGPGCGKTFLMNLFHDYLKDSNSQWSNELQKVHFHKFMLNIHQQMHEARYNNNSKGQSDAILPAVIHATLQQGRLLCFDEFQVTDVADALILQRLFTGLWQQGAIVVATSNRPPDDLYWNGIQRDRFIPFIDLLKQKCQVVSMEQSETDYRLIQKMVSGETKVYFVGLDEQKQFNQLFYDMTNLASVKPTTLTTQGGRRIHVPQAALRRGLARFSFEDLCQKALGAADYLTIGQEFHTVFVEKIPPLTLNEVNWVRRFITFVDAMYESNVKLVISCTRPLHQLFVADDKDGAHDEAFAFDRTSSRLEEMASESYLRKPWIGGGQAATTAAATVHLGHPSLADVKSTER